MNKNQNLIEQLDQIFCEIVKNDRPEAHYD